MSGLTPEAIIQALGALVGERGLLVGADMAAYEQGARYGAGQALCVVRPADVQEVQAVVRWCVEHGVHLVPQGANTGLVGASTPDASGTQIVLSTSRLRGLCEVDVANRSVTVDAGVTLQELNEQLEPHGLWFPIDLGANPTVGGMVAANTGGTRLIRYGDVRHNLLALQAVLLEPAGELLDMGRALRKDNTGPDLKQLFVGTSGAGAVLTRATLEVHVRPSQSATALVVPTSDDAVLQLLQALERDLGDYLSAFEGLSGNAMQAAIDHVPNLRNPFAPEPAPDFAILIELEAASSKAYTGLDLQEALNAFLQDQFEQTIENAVIGNGHELWHLRHSISEGARALGKPIAFDVSVPRSQIMAFCRAARAVVAAEFPFLHVVDFGHIADGGVHFNVIWRNDASQPYDAAAVQALRDRIYAMVVQQFAGSYSAEHGVGPHNSAYYHRYTTPTALQLAQGLRRLVDPRQLCGSVDFGSAPQS
ncbi:FAD-binding oxidoreductase [Acidovorax sp. Be4]|uniref:FAD-binding oxidoreductase n=1 Tax=Acidovorax bellezanensis TaxID=2976702 RepID=A0ABT2PIC5_9BURK|nr:FAD-binding oxidoreductase [Acidovorax sp. Be4]MCT9810234.1 FAD-binding oxidoreductase [Acidovorax sp. Be4]